MTLNAVSAAFDRAAAAAVRETARTLAHQFASQSAQTNRDARVQEAKASDAARPRPQDKAQPPRLLDLRV